MSTCPNGHQSGTDDWCEVCGHRMSAPAVPSSSAAGPARPVASGYDPDATAAAEPCPACGTPREGQALFCEECRYNFQTHTATTFVPAPAPASPGFPPYQRYESQRSRPSRMNRPAEPLAPEAVTPGEEGDSGDFLLTPPSAPSSPAAPSRPEAVAVREPVAAPAAPEVTTWVATVAADRDYFTAMMARSGPDATGLYFPSYSPELRLPLVGNQITIGRRRHSTGEAPDIDLSRAPEDPGVSHQHAVLVQQPDGGWSVVDQDSTNGTTVNGAADSIQPYLPVPLKDGDRVHVGAWTTITVSRA